MPNVSFIGRKTHRDPAGSQTWDLVNTSQMLLSLSHALDWTHSRGEEASLATVRLEALVTSAVRYTAYIICK